MDKEPFKDYLTVLQAARFLGVSAQTLRRWDAEGKLKSVRHPGNDYRYYKRSDLEPLRLDYNRAKQLNPGEFFEKSIADIEANDRLREPQRAAHKAIREHFERSRDPAIIQIRDWLEAKPNETEGDETQSGGNPRRFDEDMLVHGELLSDFVKQSFLDPDDDRIVDRILDAVIPGVGVPFRDFMTRDQAKAMLKKAQEKMLAVSPQPIPISPQQRRRGARKRLADRPKSVAARVLKDLKLAPGGFDVSKLISDARGPEPCCRNPAGSQSDRQKPGNRQERKE
jgi:excisionase family DNA binding protein